MTVEIDTEAFDLSTIKRVQVVGIEEINDKLLNGWLLLKIMTKRAEEGEVPIFVIGRKATEIAKTA